MSIFKPYCESFSSFHPPFFPSIVDRKGQTGLLQDAPLHTHTHTTLEKGRGPVTDLLGLSSQKEGLHYGLEDLFLHPFPYECSRWYKYTVLCLINLAPIIEEVVLILKPKVPWDGVSRTIVLKAGSFTGMHNLSSHILCPLIRLPKAVPIMAILKLPFFCYKKILIYCITGIIRKISASHIQGLKKHSRYSHEVKEILKYIVYSSQKVSFFASANH